jgi:hypothetical protein
MAFNWSCPHCGQSVTMSDEDVAHSHAGLEIGTAARDEIIRLDWRAYKCPNPQCHQFTLDIAAGFGMWVNSPSRGRSVMPVLNDGRPVRPVGIGDFRFSPRVAKPLSTHLNASVREDYEEACLIKDLSPKASATLCRRALQGMIRDFWGVSKPNLFEELKAIEHQCDPALYNAMSGLRSIGNIGAHPERDINLIIEVDEGEVDSLIGLLQVLDKEWYVARAERAARLAIVMGIGAAKALAKSPSAAALPAPPSGP